VHLSVFETVLSLVAAVAASAGTVFAYLYSRNRDARADLTAEIRAREDMKTAVDSAVALVGGVKEKVAGVESEVRGLRSEVSALGSRASILESKMDVFWKNVAFDVSKILHSPHPGWEELDALLDKFRASTISPLEMSSLTDQLHEMVDDRWPGDVSRADKVAASLLLRAIEQTRGG
jgi:hypothetical protein